MEIGISIHNDNLLLNLYRALPKEQRIEFINEIIKGINEVQLKCMGVTEIEGDIDGEKNQDVYTSEYAIKCEHSEEYLKKLANQLQPYLIKKD